MHVYIMMMLEINHEWDSGLPDYCIRSNFQGSYILRITCQEDFRVLIFADDLPLNDYTTLEIFVGFSSFKWLTSEAFILADHMGLHVLRNTQIAYRYISIID